MSTNAPQATRAIVAAVDYPKLETALLRDVDDTYYFGANCSSCLHASRLNLSKLRAHLRGDFPVAQRIVGLFPATSGPSTPNESVGKAAIGLRG